MKNFPKDSPFVDFQFKARIALKSQGDYKIIYGLNTYNESDAKTLLFAEYANFMKSKQMFSKIDNPIEEYMVPSDYLSAKQRRNEMLELIKTVNRKVNFTLDGDEETENHSEIKSLPQLETKFLSFKKQFLKISESEHETESLWGSDSTLSKYFYHVEYKGDELNVPRTKKFEIEDVDKKSVRLQFSLKCLLWLRAGFGFRIF